jgi:hypothetical protein
MRPAFNRREVIQLAGATTVAGLVGPLSNATAQTGWNAGQLAHVIPTASHERFLIKTSFKSALEQPPVLRVGNNRVQGIKTDTAGRFWMFDVPGLTPATQYDLQIETAGRQAICDAWPLKTFPAPGSRPDRLRILTYTCGGGYDGPPLAGKTFWLDMAARRKLLDVHTHSITAVCLYVRQTRRLVSGFTRSAGPCGAV